MRTTTITKINWLMFKEINAVCFENHTKPTNALSVQNGELLICEANFKYEREAVNEVQYKLRYFILLITCKVSSAFPRFFILTSEL
jgi:hypothetical protein